MLSLLIMWFDNTEFCFKKKFVKIRNDIVRMIIFVNMFSI